MTCEIPSEVILIAWLLNIANKTIWQCKQTKESDKDGFEKTNPTNTQTL
jgi:hypothetical protein